ncbi:MAG: secondary thiamine-phosphate synthase enzyme YjbQ [Bryobacteraceae bacterium]|nr:secondary thiamine-phosphate synthase enzyme YjbQ [Bryobacteraceae bacterium]
MTNAAHKLTVATGGKGLYEFTGEVERWVSSLRIATGLLTVFVQHTSASLVIQENADPDVQTDLKRFFERLAPEDPRLYVHSIEGPDDMPAHIRSALTQTSLTIPIVNSELALGTWQGIYLFEHRSGPHRRGIVLHAAGE